MTKLTKAQRLDRLIAKRASRAEELLALWIKRKKTLESRLKRARREITKAKARVKYYETSDTKHGEEWRWRKRLKKKVEEADKLSGKRT